MGNGAGPGEISVLAARARLRDLDTETRRGHHGVLYWGSVRAKQQENPDVHGFDSAVA